MGDGRLTWDYVNAWPLQPCFSMPQVFRLLSRGFRVWGWIVRNTVILIDLHGVFQLDRLVELTLLKAGLSYPKAWNLFHAGWSFLVHVVLESMTQKNASLKFCGRRQDSRSILAPILLVLEMNGLSDLFKTIWGCLSWSPSVHSWLSCGSESQLDSLSDSVGTE